MVTRLVVKDSLLSWAYDAAQHALVSTSKRMKKKGARARCRAGGTRRVCLARRGSQAKGPGSGHASHAARGASAWLAQALIAGAISSPYRVAMALRGSISEFFA